MTARGVRLMLQSETGLFTRKEILWQNDVIELTGTDKILQSKNTVEMMQKANSSSANVDSGTPIPSFDPRPTYLRFLTLIPYPLTAFPVDIVRMRADARPGFPLQAARALTSKQRSSAVPQCNRIGVHGEAEAWEGSTLMTNDISKLQVRLNFSEMAHGGIPLSRQFFLYLADLAAIANVLNTKIIEVQQGEMYRTLHGKWRNDDKSYSHYSHTTVPSLCDSSSANHRCKQESIQATGRDTRACPKLYLWIKLRSTEQSEVKQSWSRQLVVT
ncbi:hypothetical protein K0M31_005386 [Melipona bicolor]|uniref:Uncharacterized protein n=1 Tax=Melipona bicolor TaxID=60889 RepID=A0AA40FVH5_9HYME|nr:hypothetical protein K0M31_005386 [Melipona bicolor]